VLIRDLIKRDIASKVEGVVKVFDRAALATEVREYVFTDKIEEELKAVLDAFTRASEALRRGGRPRDVMGVWVSGFFGSGKSHFAKILGSLLANEELGDGTGERAIDVVMRHLGDAPRGAEIRRRLGEVKQTARVKTIAFEIRSRQSLTNPNSIGEILLGEFYRSLGLSENFVIARIERRFQEKGTLPRRLRSSRRTSTATLPSISSSSLGSPMWPSRSGTAERAILPPGGNSRPARSPRRPPPAIGTGTATSTSP
jgi:hypothetical protein